MKDKKHIVTISGKKYAIQRTFSNDPAIYINKPSTSLIRNTSKYNNFVHINDANKEGADYNTRIEHICVGMYEDDRDVIIFAHRIEDVGKTEFLFSTKEIVNIDNKTYYIDLNKDKQPLIYMGTKTTGYGCCDALYHISDYGLYTRRVISPIYLLEKLGNVYNQVIIVANLLEDE